MRAARARNVRNADVPAAACSCCAWHDVSSCEPTTSPMHLQGKVMSTHCKATCVTHGNVPHVDACECSCNVSVCL